MAELLFFPGTLSLGAKVRIARVGRHWRQVDLAEQAGVTQNDISALERDLNIYLSAEKRILQNLGLISDGIEHYNRLITAYDSIPQVRQHFEKRLRNLQNGQSGDMGVCRRR